MAGCRSTLMSFAPFRRFVVLIISVLLCLFLFTPAVSADCECGYSAVIDDKEYVFTDLIETDFAHLSDISTNTDWFRQAFNISNAKSRGSYGEMFAVQNIYTDPNLVNRKVEDGGEADGQAAGLQLAVRAERVEEMVPVAEIDTARLDVTFGSYRAGIKLTDVPGTCSAFFWYFNDTQEIDMEFLSKDFNRSNNSYPVNLVLQSREAVDKGFDAQKTRGFTKAYLPFNPTTDFHEYRIDFLPGCVRFYADNKLLANMTGPAVPDHSGHLVLRHWSNGNSLWSGGPPTQDAITTVAYVKAYFNSSASQRHSDWRIRCQDASSFGAVCQIPMATATNSTATNWFFSYQQNMTNNQTISGKNEAPTELQDIWWSVLPTVLVSVGWVMDIW